jgi:hypothetical protein
VAVVKLEAVAVNREIAMVKAGVAQTKVEEV